MSLLLVGLFGNLIKTNWPQGALQNIFALAIFLSSNSIVQTGTNSISIVQHHHALLEPTDDTGTTLISPERTTRSVSLPAMSSLLFQTEPLPDAPC